MEEKKKHKLKESNNHHFKPCSDVKGIQFGGQFVLKSFTVRRSSLLELLRLLAIHPPQQNQLEHHSNGLPFPSTIMYLPTSFTILAQNAWHTLTLGLGTKKSKVLLFVFETETMKSAVDRNWPAMFPLGDVNKRLIFGLTGCEMARFKFRKGCLTFYIYAVRRLGAACFPCAGDLRVILDSVIELKDFIDHTAMLALSNQKSITFQPSVDIANWS
ncbi:hypothetical protein IEQ34_013095 [Dendrobium chrysotoxum]|uniref:DUF7851 domain-containing protein n=1 Tax=Dendrobium chrysotoxum TaxID=161865 RepID=A0AAV7GNK6_DENCH|nr:hypothetical protein IEQ34_013095 [Dendrobium chrysotoxum]